MTLVKRQLTIKVNFDSLSSLEVDKRYIALWASRAFNIEHLKESLPLAMEDDILSIGVENAPIPAPVRP